jgi:hypothetical protein
LRFINNLSLKNIKKNTRFNVSGLLLATLMFWAFGSKEMHHVVHHQHFEVKVCNDTAQNENHFHDQEYSHDDCSLCDFTFSVFELAFTQKLDFPQAQTFITARVFSDPSFVLSFKFPVLALLRGPPSIYPFSQS